MLTKPILKTSSAFIFCPVNIICFAIEMPIILANFRVAPNPGVISRLTSGCPKIAFSENILIYLMAFHIWFQVWNHLLPRLLVFLSFLFYRKHYSLFSPSPFIINTLLIIRPELHCLMHPKPPDEIWLLMVYHFLRCILYIQKYGLMIDINRESNIKENIYVLVFYI